MTEIESKHGIVSRQPYEVYMSFTDLSNFVRFLPADKREGIQADYDTLTDGKWTEGMDAAVLHRCAVAAKYRGSGVAEKMIRFIDERALARSLRCIRTDTHKKNKPMQSLLRESGYRYRGNVLVQVNEGHDPARQAYEKILKK